MLTAVIAGIFTLVPLLLTYLSSRDRQLSLLQREVGVLTALEKHPEAQRPLVQTVETHAAEYAALVYALGQPAAKGRRWGYVFWVCYFVSAVCIAVGMNTIPGADDTARRIGVVAILVGALAFVLAMIGMYKGLALGDTALRRIVRRVTPRSILPAALRDDQPDPQ